MGRSFKQIILAPGGTFVASHIFPTRQRTRQLFCGANAESPALAGLWFWYCYVILWLRGRTTYNVASLFCWLVASPRNQKLGDPSSATFSCLTIYTASKMTRCKSLLSQLRYFPTICASCKKMDLLFPLRWATSRGHSTGSVNAIPIAVRENRFVPSRHSSDQMLAYGRLGHRSF